MENFSILSIDPGGIGGHTGIAFGFYSDDSPYQLVGHAHLSDDIQGFCDWLHLNIVTTDGHLGPIHHMNVRGNWHPIDYAIMENFEDFGVRGADWTPLELIGAAKYVFGDDLIMRRPIDRKAVSDDAMKALGAYVPGGHHRDATEAARHAVAWLMKQGHKPTIQKGWPHAKRF